MTVHKTNYASHCMIIVHLKVWRSTHKTLVKLKSVLSVVFINFKRLISSLHELFKFFIHSVVGG